MELKSLSPQNTKELAFQFIGSLEKKSDRALVVGLYGDLGAGKTTFIKGAAEKLGLEKTVSSPTFVIEKIYRLGGDAREKYGFKNLIHIDAYRLESGEELRALGWDEILLEDDNLIMLEWPENVAGVLPEDHVKIRMRYVSENERMIDY